MVILPFAMVILNIIDTLIGWDKKLFIFINSSMANPVFDAVLPYFRYPYNWAPLYFFFIAFALINFKKKGLWWVLFLIVSFACADMIGTHLFKHVFERLRPCNDPFFRFHVRLLVEGCSTGYSFVSNHAINHFALASFFYFSTKDIIPRYAWIAWLWAALIGFAQVYVGVHYPFDVLVGAFLGINIGALVYFLLFKKLSFPIFDN